MSRPYDRPEGWDDLHEKIIGLGERSLRKTYFPELQRKLADLERFRALLDESGEGLLLVQLPSLTVVDANLMAGKLLQVPRADLVGHPFSVNGKEGFDAALHGLLLRWRDGPGDEERLDGQCKEADGAVIPVEVLAHRMTFSGQMYVLLLMRNLLERKRAEAENQILQDRLAQAQKLESVGRLAGGIAHDFNNLLAGIMGALGVIDAKLQPTGQLRELLDEVRKAAESGASLSRQLLGFSRRQVVEPRPIDFNSTIQELVKILRRLLPENVSLDVVLAPEGRRVCMDPVQVEQVLVNLVVNARDAMPNGGRITIRTSHRPAEIAPGAFPPPHDDQGHLLLEVADTGVGMTEEVRVRLFEPFFTTKPRDKGTGLGLATTMGIVRQNRGWIEVESETGKGSLFRVFLPALPVEQGAPGLPLPKSALQRGTETILLVEDDDGLRKLGIQILTHLGYQVLACRGGREAIALAKQTSGPIDLVLTDVVMPGMEGPALVAALQSDRPALKAVFVSGYTLDVVSQKGVPADNRHFLAKPFRPSELAHKVRTLLDG